MKPIKKYLKYPFLTSQISLSIGKKKKEKKRDEEVSLKKTAFFSSYTNLQETAHPLSRLLHIF